MSPEQMIKPRVEQSNTSLRPHWNLRQWFIDAFRQTIGPPKNFKGELHSFSSLNSRYSKNLEDIVPQQRAQLGKGLSQRDLCYGSNEVNPNMIHR